MTFWQKHKASCWRLLTVLVLCVTLPIVGYSVAALLLPGAWRDGPWYLAFGAICATPGMLFLALVFEYFYAKRLGAFSWRQALGITVAVAILLVPMALATLELLVGAL